MWECGIENPHSVAKSDRSEGNLGTRYLLLAPEVRAALQDWSLKPTESGANSGQAESELNWIVGHLVGVGELEKPCGKDTTHLVSGWKTSRAGKVLFLDLAAGYVGLPNLEDPTRCLLTTWALFYIQVMCQQKVYTQNHAQHHMSV